MVGDIKALCKQRHGGWQPFDPASINLEDQNFRLTDWMRRSQWQTDIR